MKALGSVDVPVHTSVCTGSPVGLSGVGQDGGPALQLQGKQEHYCPQSSRPRWNLLHLPASSHSSLLASPALQRLCLTPCCYLLQIVPSVALTKAEAHHMHPYMTPCGNIKQDVCSHGPGPLSAVCTSLHVEVPELARGAGPLVRGSVCGGAAPGGRQHVPYEQAHTSKGSQHQL